MIKLILAFFLALVSSYASATQTLMYSYDNFVTQGTSVDAACMAWGSKQANVTGGPFPPSSNQGYCQVITTTGVLTAGSVQSKMVDVNNCEAGKMVTGNFSMRQGSDGLLIPPNAIGGCKAGLMSVSRCWKYIDTGEKVCTIKYNITGEQAGAGGDNANLDTAPGTAAKTDTNYTASAGASGGASGGSNACPAGSVAGGVDSGGVQICIGTGTNTDKTYSNVVTKPTTSSTASDGTVTSLNETVTTNPDGTSTTVTTTTTAAPDGTTTTGSKVVTSKLPDGSDGVPSVYAGKPGQAPETSDFCKQNPLLAVCRNSSVSGTCGAIACQGDPILCSILRETAIMQCRQKADTDAINASSAKALGDSILNGADPMQTQFNALKAGTTVDLSQQNLDGNGWVGGRTCFSAKTMTFAGRTFTADFTAVCNTIQPLRYAVMACCSIIAYLIISKAVTR